MMNLNSRDDIGQVINSVEDQIDLALAQVSDLMSKISRLRVGSAESAIATQRPLNRMASLQQALLTARRKITGVHGDMAKFAINARDLPLECPCMGMKSRADGEFASTCQ